MPPPLRVVIYRRLMLRIAERLARDAGGASALVTGEVVGQVASQTLENIAVIDAVATLPILRPLVGMDKEEIVAPRPAPRHLPDLDHPGPGLLPAVHAAPPGDACAAGEVEAAEQVLPVEEWVARRPPRHAVSRGVRLSEAPGDLRRPEFAVESEDCHQTWASRLIRLPSVRRVRLLHDR